MADEDGKWVEIQKSFPVRPAAIAPKVDEGAPIRPAAVSIDLGRGTVTIKTTTNGGTQGQNQSAQGKDGSK